MGLAYFERVNRTRGEFGYYRYLVDEISSDNSALSVEWKTVRRPKRQRRELLRGPGDMLWRHISERCAPRRFSRGYLLAGYLGPPEPRARMEAQLDKLSVFSGDGGTAASLFYDLPKLRSVFKDGDGALRLEALRDLLDPVPASSGAPNTPACWQPLLPGVALEDDVNGHVRALLAQFVHGLLRDDPRARTAILKVLSTPKNYGRDGVIHLVGGGEALNVPLFQLLRRSAELMEVAYRLADDGIRTVGELVAMDIAVLKERYALDDDQLDKIDRSCGRFGLQLGMKRCRQAGLPQTERWAS